MRLYRYMEQMGKRVENMGVWTITVLVAVVVIAYSLWGASVLNAQHSPAFSTTASALGTNL